MFQLLVLLFIKKARTIFQVSVYDFAQILSNFYDCEAVKGQLFSFFYNTPS